jgi:hypothetical protein
MVDAEGVQIICAMPEQINLRMGIRLSGLPERECQAGLKTVIEENYWEWHSAGITTNGL